MISLFTQKEFEKAKAHHKLKCQCHYCNGEFFAKKNHIKMVLEKININLVKYCSKKCKNQSQKKKKIVKCKNCNKSFYKIPAEIKKSKSGNHFCSKSCAVTYNNKHKTHGTRRSKLEIYLEEQLLKLYPKINFHFNRKDTINSELDIYIPSFKLAFEINGIFHYEPIFGQEKFEKIQNNDKLKLISCCENKIDLHVINTSKHKYVIPKTSQKYLNIIKNIIDKHPSCI